MKSRSPLRVLLLTDGQVAEFEMPKSRRLECQRPEAHKSLFIGVGLETSVSPLAKNNSTWQCGFSIWWLMQGGSKESNVGFVYTFV